MSLIAWGGRSEGDRVCEGEACTLHFKSTTVNNSECAWCSHDQARIKKVKKVNGSAHCKMFGTAQFF